MTHLVYLASPYSDPDPLVKEQRYLNACKAAGLLMSCGNMVYSPIAHTHVIARLSDLPGDFKYWEQFDRRMLTACDSMIVLTDKGWKESKGVTAEIKIAEEMEMPITYMTPYWQE